MTTVVIWKTVGLLGKWLFINLSCQTRLTVRTACYYIYRVYFVVLFWFKSVTLFVLLPAWWKCDLYWLSCTLWRALIAYLTFNGFDHYQLEWILICIFSWLRNRRFPTFLEIKWRRSSSISCPLPTRRNTRWWKKNLLPQHPSYRPYRSHCRVFR